MAEQSTQLNVRMDRTLREAGDAALAAQGYTPAKFVRLVWEKAARRGKDLEELLAVLGGSRGRRPEDSSIALGGAVLERPAAAATEPQNATVSPRQAEPSSWVAKRDKLWAEFLEAVNLTEEQALSSYVERPYKEMLEEALAEKYLGTQPRDSV